MANSPDLEIVVTPSPGFASTEGAPLAKAREAFDALGVTLKEAVGNLHQAWEEHAPDELELRLELAFKGEAKWVVISAGGQATIGVKLVWKRK
jgi:hypothetical protein